ARVPGLRTGFAAEELPPRRSRCAFRCATLLRRGRRIRRALETCALRGHELRL
ncbi:MAG: hypothetical protein AVDCRST_MAG80-1288, partial [uncultured Rubrobacteraceae bacterium]